MTDSAEQNSRDAVTRNSVQNADVSAIGKDDVADSSSDAGQLQLNTLSVMGAPFDAVQRTGGEQNPFTTGSTIQFAAQTSEVAQKIQLPGLTVENTTDRPGMRIEVPAQSPEALSYFTNRDSVVRIQGTNIDTNQPTTGSGFFVTRDGLLVTDYHVVAKAKNIIVQTADGKRYVATIAKVFEEKDLAALQIQIFDGSKTTPVVLPSKPVAYEPNAPVAALGYPGSHTELHISPGVYMSAGKLSEENITGGFLGKEDKNRAIHRLLADTRPGSSGSLVVSLATGEVMGIQGLSNKGGRTIVTPAQDVKALVDAVMAGRGQHINLAAYGFPVSGKPIHDVRSGFTISGGGPVTVPDTLAKPLTVVPPVATQPRLDAITGMPASLPTNSQTKRNPFKIGG